VLNAHTSWEVQAPPGGGRSLTSLGMQIAAQLQESVVIVFFGLFHASGLRGCSTALAQFASLTTKSSFSRSGQDRIPLL